MNPTVSKVDITVVVGKVTVLDSKDAPQLIARAVPLSVILIIKQSSDSGVPVRFVVNEVIAADNAVIS
jgi:hypothetical protein